MLTIKLSRKNNTAGDKGPSLWTTKIVEASEVDIHELRVNELSEIEVVVDGKSMVFYIADNNGPRPAGFAESVLFWHNVYIENSTGATTHVVR